MTNPYDAVVGIAESKDGSRVHFRNLLTIKGNIPEKFDVISYWSDQNEPPIIEDGNILIPPPPCGGCAPEPHLKIGKTYFMTLYRSDSPDDVNPTAYIIPKNCYHFFGEVFGWYDPRVLGYALAIYGQPVWMRFVLVYVWLARILETLIPG